MKKIYIIIVILISICFYNNVFANNIDNNVEEINKFINDFSIEFEKISSIKDENLKKESLYKLSNKILDLNWMGNFILGKHRNNIKPNDKKEFIELYSKLLIQNYIPILDVYKKDGYKIISIESKKENTFNVLTLINYNDKEVKNSFRIIKKNNNYFIIDIITEGISFISSQRSEVNSIITSKGFDNFLNDLRKRNNDNNK